MLALAAAAHLRPPPNPAPPAKPTQILPRYNPTHSQARGYHQEQNMAGGKRPLPKGQKTLAAFFSGGSKKSKPTAANTAAAGSTEPAAPSSGSSTTNANAMPPPPVPDADGDANAAAAALDTYEFEHGAHGVRVDHEDSSDDESVDEPSAHAPRRRSRPDTGTTTAPSVTSTVSI